MLICGVGRVGPRHKRQNTLRNESTKWLVDKVAAFNSLWKKGNMPPSELFATWTKYWQVTKLALYFTHFPSRFSYLFIKILFTKNVLSNKDYLLLIYTFMGNGYNTIIFWRRVPLSCQSHQMCTLARIWEWPGIGTDCPVILILLNVLTNIIF